MIPDDGLGSEEKSRVKWFPFELKVPWCYVVLVGAV
jgi:hypothetical protein